MKKKVWTALLAGMMVISLGACGEKTDEQNDKPGGTSDSTMTQAESEDNLYTLQVQIKSAQTAEILIQGVSVDDSAEGALWGVEFDDTYSVYLDNYEDTIQCSACETEEDGGRRLIKEMDYIIAGSSLRIIADFSGTEGFDFYNTSTYTLIVDEEGDGCRPIELAAADVVVDSLAYEYANDETKGVGSSENLEVNQEEENAQDELREKEKVEKHLLELLATGQPYEESDFPVNEGDEMHFKPMTDDYMLYMHSVGTEEFRTVWLVSFDEAGNVCQFIEKRIYKEEEVCQRDWKEYSEYNSGRYQVVGKILYSDFSDSTSFVTNRATGYSYGNLGVDIQTYDGKRFVYATDSYTIPWFSKFGSAEQEMAAKAIIDGLDQLGFFR